MSQLLDRLNFLKSIRKDTFHGKIAEAMEKAAWITAARRFIDELLAQAEISAVQPDAAQSH